MFQVQGARFALPELRRIFREGRKDPSLRSGQALNSTGLSAVLAQPTQGKAPPEK